jgi:phage terminase small subunit
MPNHNVPGPVSGGTGKRALTRGPNRKLTRRQEKFVKELVSNDGLITHREAALRAGYPAASCSSRAHELTNPKYCPHVVAEIERHIRSMATIRNLALENGAYSAAVQAEYRRGQAQGDIYVSKSEIRTGSIDQMSRADVEKELERIRAGFEQIIDVTPESVEIEEPDSERGADESGSRPLEDNSGRPEDDDEEDRDDAP